jgi:hypothetical protein
LSLGIALEEQGDLNEAEEEFAAADRLEPAIGQDP